MKLMNLSRYLPYRMNVAAATLSYLFEEVVLVDEQINFPQWRILALLGSEGPSPQQSFVRRTNMDKITISRTVSSLIDIEAVESRVAKSDKRARMLELTDHGRELFKRLSVKALKLEQEVAQLAGLTDVERLLDELDRMESAVRTLRRSHPL